MSRRYPHWLQHATALKPLRRIVCVSADADLIRVAVMMEIDGAYAIHAYAQPADADALYDALEDATSLAGSCAIVSYDCPAIWERVGLWQAITRGKVILTGLDPRSVEGKRAAEREARLAAADPLAPVHYAECERYAAMNVGCMVLEDPPCILKARFGASARGAVWIDLRNHGPRWPASDRSAVLDMSRLVTWVREYTDLLRRLEWGALASTAGSQAMRGFRTNYYTGGIFCGSDKRELEASSRAYFGGAVGAVQLGRIASPVWIYDIRAAYPFICAHHRLPVRRICGSDDTGIRQEERSAGDTDGIYDCALETDCAQWPVRRDGSVIYSRGRFHATLCGPEYRRAAAAGAVRTVERQWQYATEPSLSGFARKLWSERQHVARHCGKDAEASVKMLANCLMGKFAQRSRRWVHCPDQVADVSWGQWEGTGADRVTRRYRAVAGSVWREEDDGWAYDAMPALAAFVTSYQRTRLFQAIDTVGPETVVYWDTDSIVTTRECLADLQAEQPGEPDGFGAWRLVEGPCEIEIFGLRSYRTSTRTVLAGEPKGGDVQDQRDDAVLRRRAALDALVNHEQPGGAPVWTGLRSAGFAGTLNVDRAGRVIVPELKEW